MILYHGSSAEVKTINLKLGRSNVDFGNGFYTTTLNDQAVKWAKSKSAARGSVGVVSKFEFDTDRSKMECKIKKFDGYSSDWLKFVLANRSSGYFKKNPGADNNRDLRYDIVIGPIADDFVAETINAYMEGRMSFSTVLAELRTRKTSNQYSFHTAKGVEYLKFLGSVRVGK